MKAVYHVVWTESEAGWGPRPDGETYHKDEDTMNKFIERYAYSNPDEYSFPEKKELIEVDKKIYDQVQEKGTVWKHNLK